MQICKYAELDGSLYRCSGTKEKDPCQFKGCMSCCPEFKPDEKFLNTIAKRDSFLSGIRAALRSEGYSEEKIEGRIDFGFTFADFMSKCTE